LKAIEGTLWLCTSTPEGEEIEGEVFAVSSGNSAPCGPTYRLPLRIAPNLVEVLRRDVIGSEPFFRTRLPEYSLVFPSAHLKQLPNVHP
jgi:hypothetical protein